MTINSGGLKVTGGVQEAEYIYHGNPLPFEHGVVVWTTGLKVQCYTLGCNVNSGMTVNNGGFMVGTYGTTIAFQVTPLDDKQYIPLSHHYHYHTTINIIITPSSHHYQHLIIIIFTSPSHHHLSLSLSLSLSGSQNNRRIDDLHRRCLCGVRTNSTPSVIFRICGYVRQLINPCSSNSP